MFNIVKGSKPKHEVKSAIFDGISQTSAEVIVGPIPVCGLVIPSSIVGTSVSFLVSVDQGSTYVQMADMEDGSTPVSIDIAVDTYIPLNPVRFVGITRIKIVSDAVEVEGTEFSVVLRTIE